MLIGSKARPARRKNNNSLMSKQLTKFTASHYIYNERQPCFNFMAQLLNFTGIPLTLNAKLLKQHGLHYSHIQLLTCVIYIQYGKVPSTEFFGELFDEFFDNFLTYNLLTNASFRIGVPSILFLSCFLFIFIFCIKN